MIELHQRNGHQHVLVDPEGWDLLKKVTADPATKTVTTHTHVTLTDIDRAIRLAGLDVYRTDRDGCPCDRPTT